MILLAIIASRFRHQIENILYLWRVLKKMNQPKDQKQFEPSENTKELPLIKCIGCGVWTPENFAFKLRSNDYYCSKKCLENSLLTQRN